MQSSDDNLLMAQRVGQLMERHAIPKSKQTGALAKTLGLSPAQAHRKMRGQSNWTYGELRDVAAAFNASITALLDPETSEHAQGVPALLDFGNHLVPCQAWIGPEILTGQGSEYVAMSTAGSWRLYPSDMAPRGKKFVVELIEIRPKSLVPTRLTVAVVDDDGGSDAQGGLRTADTVCMYLNSKGYDARAFYSAAAFREALKQTVFDAYVVDWMLDHETAETALSEIRTSDNPDAPVFILTGQMQAGNVNESDIARAITAFDVDVLEKPARLPLLVAELNKRLAQR
ncbi:MULTISPECIES: response regulator [Pandoraea]|jgi:CheY-like chemotaxis protein|uniref:BetR domain n=1 Tax=Pandoraea pnomenusa TaxID=93220 RepID=A0A378YBX9_9BURK|nr:MULTISPECIES: helix-turn-helix domain-containing protein [Pandoraea]AHB05921.1 hypothetical protein U875_11510 [Pandoraea pnomenusa 3kgm]AHB78010.1 hypothetical protein X636_23200 [Pandoraea pnomenusa]AHN73693.1 hypothetical protein DA70_03900 [Pandoraea pnomenusa]AIU25551.1 hypothetical protein LV28_02410 [Pandoraea pnomenusa]ANC46688.1 hypothetical protein A6P55_23460 [Pandoraea pnomenusa]